MCLSACFPIFHELFVLKDFHEGGDGGVSGFGFIVSGDDIVHASTLWHFPKDVHDLNFGFGQSV